MWDKPKHRWLSSCCTQSESSWETGLHTLWFPRVDNRGMNQVQRVNPVYLFINMSTWKDYFDSISKKRKWRERWTVLLLENSKWICCKRHFRRKRDEARQRLRFEHKKKLKKEVKNKRNISSLSSSWWIEIWSAELCEQLHYRQPSNVCSVAGANQSREQKKTRTF